MNPMNIETRATLLSQLRDGSSPLAWEEFFQRYWPLIHAFARRRGCSDNTAEDVVQEVMLKIFERRDVFLYDASRGRFRDWLGTVVRNQVAQYRRSPSGRARVLPGESPAFREKETGEGSPDTLWERAFENAVLLAILDVIRREVDPRDYLAFELTTLSGMEPAGVAAITGLSRNAIYKARRRVLRRLRALAGGYATDGRLPERVKEALEMRPAPATERTMTRRVRETIRGV